MNLKVKSRMRLAVLALVLAPVGDLVAQARWVAKGHGFRRTETAIAHDAARGVTVMFGGLTRELNDGSPGSEYLSDTWAWDGSSWEKRSPSASPPARKLHAMAYDSLRQRIVLFGGEGRTGLLGDTWEWDGSTWHHRSVTVSPPVRMRHSMVYDAARQLTLLFGDQQGDNQLWAWDGNTWRQLASANRPPSIAVSPQRFPMAYDSERAVTVLLSVGFPRSIWEWDGSDWQQTPGNPLGSVWDLLNYDSVRKTSVLTTRRFIYIDLFGTLTTTHVWDYDGDDWTERGGSAPYQPRVTSTFDSTRGSIMVLGGTEESVPSGHVFISGGQGFERLVPPEDPGLVAGHEMVFDPVRGRTLLFGGSITLGRDSSRSSKSQETWEWDGERWFRFNPASSPPPRRHFAMVYDSGRQRTVLFGGDHFPRDNDTWEWDGSTWTLRNPTARPSVRIRHAMAYDSDRGRIVLFGGVHPLQFETQFNDTWEYDGQEWTLVDTFVKPPGLVWHAMAYDPVRKRTVLHGGKTYSPFPSPADGRTWEYDGQDWRVKGVGPVVQQHELVFDSDQGRVVLVGGLVEGGNTDLVWAWNGQHWIPTLAANQPSERKETGAAYDSVRGTVVLFGGSKELGSDPSDTGTWELRDPRLERYTTFGNGCAGSAGAPTLSAVGLPPRMGHTFQVRVDNVPPGAPVFMLLGYSKSRFGELTLPLNLNFFGMPGCSFYTSAEHSGLLPDSVGGSTTWTVDLGNDPWMLGFRFYNQAFVFDPIANALGLTSSNMGSAVIGL